MKWKGGIAAVVAAGWICQASAFTSPYSSMAVPGTHNGWSTAPSMVLMADNVWVCTQTFASGSGDFKFAANGSWDINWGGNAALIRVPAFAQAPTLGGGNLSYSGFSNGPYRIIFNDTSLVFRVEWAGATPLPLPVFSNISLVGNFNGWTPGVNVLTNHASDTNLWSVSVNLDSETTFQFYPNGSHSNQYGAPAATTLSPPVSNVSACGRSDFTLSGFDPGTFRFVLNTSNATVAISQTATQTFTVMTVQGNLVATTNPPANMTRIAGTALWESDHHLTNSGTVTLRFSGNHGARRWAATNGTPAYSLPASGTLIAGLTNFAQITGVTPGRYRITFNHQSGAFSFQQSYTDNSGINLLKNPGFEQGADTNGAAPEWGGWQSWPKQVSEGFLPHSGRWCGAIHGKLYPDWTDYASYAQTVLVTSGRLYRASGWFMATPDWAADSMQIKIEWRDNFDNPIGSDDAVNLPTLTTNWTKHSVEGIAPTNATKAHVVFLCSGAYGAGKMLVDDLEMRAVAGRTQNFDTWGALTNFASFAPDWSVTSGRTMINIPPGRPPAGVFISQYVEGTANNKAIEIFNGNIEPVNLEAGNYVLQQYNNGSLTASVTMALSGTLMPGEVLVVGRPSVPTNFAPDVAISGLPNLLTNKHLTFNGDDVIVLRAGGASGTVLDRVGQVGSHAVGSLWSRSTTDRTLIRKPTIVTGTTTAITAPFPLEEWSSHAKDSFHLLGTHDISFVDPNEPYTPGGYSLVMNSGATLMSGDLPGGVGDLSFWWRTESIAPAVTMVVETAISSAGPWTNVATLAGYAATNFGYYAINLNRPEALYLRIRQTDGGTNRFRIDEITISPYAAIKRIEDFNAWTDPAYTLPGTYSRYGWNIQSASITPNGGVLNSRAAWLEPPAGAVASPTYSDGVGETVFWAKAVDQAQYGQLLLQTTEDGGSNWTTRGTFLATTGRTYSTWLYLTNPAQARLVFDPTYDNGEVLVDNVEVRLPMLYRNQNFDSWPTRGSYTSETYQGWAIADCIVDSLNAYDGQSARLNITLNNFIRSPEFPDGLGSLSFRTRKWATNDAAYTLALQVSSNGVSWTTVTNFVSVGATNSPAATNYVWVTLFRQDPSNRFWRILHSAGAVRVMIDDIRVGVLQPRPQVLITPAIDPNAPATNETIQITADIISRYGATVLSVTGAYAVAGGPTNFISMVPVSYGTYVSVSSIPAQPAGTLVRYFVRVQYAGIGANTNFGGYATNLATSVTNSYQVSSVKKGAVWINEISYLNYSNDWEEDREFIELCGQAGVSISNWTIQLAFGSDAAIAKNSNQPVYATYRITSGHTFSNQTSGFSFYVLGDQQLLDAGEKVDRVLTVFVPTSVVAGSVADRNHIHNDRGVIRLLNEYSNVVYALSYEGYVAGAQRIPTAQAPNSTNAVSLVGSGTYFSDFGSWARTNYTIGAVNAGQTLVPPGGSALAVVWHVPELLATPLNTNVPAFYLRHPANAQSKSNLWIHFGFPNALYTQPSGILYHRRAGYGWTNAAMALLPNSLDAISNAYVRGEIPARTYSRGTTIEYVIAAICGAGTATTYIGYDATNDFALFETLNQAQASPFTYTYQILPEIYVDYIVTNATSWIFYTGGNERSGQNPPEEPFTNFRVRTSTNPLIPLHLWTTSSFTVTPVDSYGSNVFTIPQTNAPILFYRIDALWP